MYAHFAEALDGIVSIRAFGLQQAFCRTQEQHVAMLQRATITGPHRKHGVCCSVGNHRFLSASICSLMKALLPLHWVMFGLPCLWARLAGVVAAQWLAVRLQTIAAVVVALVALLSAAESNGMLPGPSRHAATNISESTNLTTL